MVVRIEEKINFLRNRQLFKNLDPESLEMVAGRLGELKLQENELIINEGDEGDTFFIIYSGSVRIWKYEHGEEVDLAFLERGDKFGEEALLFHRKRSATVETTSSTVLLTFNEENFNWLIRTFPETKLNIRAIAESHKEARKQRFDWLQDHEVIYLITRRHKAELAIDLIKPAIAFIVTLLIFGLGQIIKSMFNQLFPFFIGLTILSFVVGVLMTLWEIVDWQNDYFIITNQRVIWLEQIAFQSASRQEAPLSAIQSVNVETNQIGRILGYGNINIRTFTGTGSLRLTNVDNPNRFREIIEELLLRVRRKTETAKSDRMRQAIRESIGFDAGSKIKTDVGIVDPDPEISTRYSLFKAREVLGDTIIYHRHWWVFVKKTWIPSSIIFGLLLLLSIPAFSGTSNIITIQVLLLIGTPLLFGLGIYWLYYFLDWKNDLYKVTRDTIIDSEKKPLGSETTKSAPIKNIQSMEQHRSGLLRIIMNFGTVTINVADAQLVFNDIYNPSQALQDIFYRQERLKFDEEEGSAERERQRMAEWMAAYHDVWADEQIQPENLNEIDEEEETN